MIVTTGRNNGLCCLDSRIQKRVNEACGSRKQLALEEHCVHDFLASWMHFEASNANDHTLF